MPPFKHREPTEEDMRRWAEEDARNAKMNQTCENCECSRGEHRIIDGTLICPTAWFKHDDCWDGRDN